MSTPVPSTAIVDPPTSSANHADLVRSEELGISYRVKQYRRICNFSEPGGIRFAPVEHQLRLGRLDFFKFVRRVVECEATMDCLGDRRADADRSKLRYGGVKDSRRATKCLNEFESVPTTKARSEMQSQPVKRRFLVGCGRNHLSCPESTTFALIVLWLDTAKAGHFTKRGNNA